MSREYLEAKSRTDDVAIQTLIEQVAKLKGELEGEEQLTAMLASLNKRAAEALGKRTTGKVLDTWHDIPERIVALKGQVRTLEEAVHIDAGRMAQLEDTIAEFEGQQRTCCKLCDNDE